MTVDTKTQLNGIFKQLNIQAKNIELFDAYINTLKQWNKKINLISRKESNIIDNILGPSLLFFKEYKGSDYNIIDLGSGAGFPALAIKIYNPKIRITMVDSNYKKTTFLNFICSKLNLKCRIMNTTFEQIKLKNEQFHFITSRGINLSDHLINLIKQKIQSRQLIHFTSENITLALDLKKTILFNSTAMKIYSL
jgi:16S rRNA (guanine527-N7)-methyltransferase